MAHDVRELLQKGRKWALKRSMDHLLYNYDIAGPSIIRTVCNIHPRLVDDPFKVYWIDPSRITHISEAPRIYGIRCGGDWDIECARFETCGAWRSIQAYFKEGNQDILFEVFKDHLERPQGRPWGHDSIETFENRVEEIEQLYASIQEHGYLSQRELVNRHGEAVRERNNEPVPPTLNEVTVDIGRDGEPLYAGFGSHRLSTAKLLGINEVPVIVAVRHTAYDGDEW